MQTKHQMSIRQIEWLKNNYPNLGSKEASKYLQVPIGKIKKLASNLKLKVTKERFFKKQTENGLKSVDKNTKYYLDSNKINWFKNNYPLLGGKACANSLAIPYSYVRNLANRLSIRVNKETSIKNKRGKIPHNKKYYVNTEWLKNNYSLLGGSKCSEYLKIPIRIINKYATRFGIRVLNSTRSKNQSKNAIEGHLKRRNKTMEKANDIKILTPEQAYTLGFLWGDGYLSCPKNTKCCYPYVGIQREDFDKLINIFQGLGNWHTYYRKCKGRKEQGEAYLCNNTMGYFMRTNDYKLKSQVSPEKILSIVPEYLKHYWWRGYIDADGCFYINDIRNICQFSLAGSYNQDWSEFKNLLASLGVTCSIKRRIRNQKSKSSIVSLSNRKNIVKLGEYIYNGILNIGLNRKYKKFLAIKTKSENSKNKTMFF